MYLLRVPMLVYKPKIMKELMPENPPHSSKKQQFYPEVLSMYYVVDIFLPKYISKLRKWKEEFLF